eukprot:6045540-Pyramimonas_sp.AAC.1
MAKKNSTQQTTHHAKSRPSAKKIIPITVPTAQRPWHAKLTRKSICNANPSASNSGDGTQFA